MIGNAVFQIEQTSRHGWVRVAVVGELDVSTALTFRRHLRTLRAANTPVRLDLSQVEFIDSAGAHSVLDALTAAQEGAWRLEVEPVVSDQVKRYFALFKAAGLRGGVQPAG